MRDGRQSVDHGLCGGPYRICGRKQRGSGPFPGEYAASVEFVNGNVEEAAALSGKFDVIAEEVAAKAIPECNIVFWEGEQMREAAEGFLTVLYNANPQSVGGALPDEGLYYEK